MVSERIACRMAMLSILVYPQFAGRKLQAFDSYLRWLGFFTPYTPLCLFRFSSSAGKPPSTNEMVCPSSEIRAATEKVNSQVDSFH